MTRLAAIFLLLATLGAQAQGVLNRGNSFEPDSLDPHFAGTTAESNIIGDLLEGLTAFDAAGKPMPGIAERWEISKDGLTWTFHLRQAQWSDGTPVTAGQGVILDVAMTDSPSLRLARPAAPPAGERRPAAPGRLAGASA